MLSVVILSVIVMSVVVLLAIRVHVIIRSVIMMNFVILSVIFLSIFLPECRNEICHHAECRYAKCRELKCRGAPVWPHSCKSCRVSASISVQSGANITKLFLFVNDALVKYARVLVPNKPFPPRLFFQGAILPERGALFQVSWTHT